MTNITELHVMLQKYKYILNGEISKHNAQRRIIIRFSLDLFKILQILRKKNIYNRGRNLEKEKEE